MIDCRRQREIAVEEFKSVADKDKKQKSDTAKTSVARSGPRGEVEIPPLSPEAAARFEKAHGISADSGGLTKEPKARQAGQVGGKLDEDRKPRHMTGAEDAPSLPGRDPLNTVRELAHRLVPEPQESDLAYLSAAIDNARRVPPGEREEFVRNVNRLLAAHGLALEVSLGRQKATALLLTIKNGSIQYQPMSGDSCGLNNPARLVRR